MMIKGKENRQRKPTNRVSLFAIRRHPPHCVMAVCRPLFLRYAAGKR
jgi:hypothetical protein